MVDGIPATTPERTIVAMAVRSSLSFLEVVLDDAEHRNLVTDASLWSTVERLATRGRPGIRKLRTLLESRSSVDGIPESVTTPAAPILRRTSGRLSLNCASVAG
jgi:hypothetical protein